MNGILSVCLALAANAQLRVVNVDASCRAQDSKPFRVLTFVYYDRRTNNRATASKVELQPEAQAFVKGLAAGFTKRDKAALGRWLQRATTIQVLLDSPDGQKLLREDDAALDKLEREQFIALAGVLSYLDFDDQWHGERLYTPLTKPSDWEVPEPWGRKAQRSYAPVPRVLTGGGKALLKAVAAELGLDPKTGDVLDGLLAFPGWKADFDAVCRQQVK